MVTMEKPQARAWFLGEEIDPADPLAAVKQRARDIVAEAEERERTARKADVKKRADVIDPAAALFADPAFDLEETYDAAEAALPGADVNAASYIGLVLREVELNGGGGGD
jgi:hypothetical protein